MSTDYDQHLILHHLDDPLRLLKWTVDEAAIISGTYILWFLALNIPL